MHSTKLNAQSGPFFYHTFLAAVAMSDPFMGSFDGVLNPAEELIPASHFDQQNSASSVSFETRFPAVQDNWNEIVSAYDEASSVTGRSSVCPSMDSDAANNTRSVVGDSGWLTLDTQGTAEIVVSKPFY